MTFDVSAKDRKLWDRLRTGLGKQFRESTS
jgi:hypothetical protein